MRGPITPADWSPMKYKNTEIKLASLVGFFNENTINLNPAFQRGHKWSLRLRRKLIENIIKGRPIPAIFLYKDAKGPRYYYNILDGKQRLESLLLFIGHDHPVLKIDELPRYFFSADVRKNFGFSILLDGRHIRFKDIDDATLREFREYVIPTIEITLDDDTALSEIIDLFVDINQSGVKVSRFDIAKAMSKKNFLLKSVFSLLALEQNRGEDRFYKVKDNEFSHVLNTLTVVAKAPTNQTQVDRMWERLLEISRFAQTNEHRKTVDILKSFISAQDEKQVALSKEEQNRLRTVFRFLRDAYKRSALRETLLATNQTHFYTMVTSLLSSDTLTEYPEDALIEKLAKFGKLLESGAAKPADKKLANALSVYATLSRNRTTDSEPRKTRQEKFLQIVKAL